MGDVSMMARRLDNKYVQYGWCGNGGYYRSVGIRLLAWYEDPDDVEYLFGLGQTSLIGTRGSENGGEHVLLTNRPTGEPCWLGKSEREIFSKIAFADYGYFYDLDNKWYYIVPGPFRIKMPLKLIANNLNERDYEFDFCREVGDKILRYILGTYREKSEDFAKFLDTKGYKAEDIITNIDDCGLLSVMNFYRQYKDIFEYFDDWVVVHGKNNDAEVGEIVVKKKTEKHVETCDWGQEEKKE